MADLLLTDWLSSTIFHDTPEAQLIFGVILQAIEDSDMRISDPLIMPNMPNPDFYPDPEAYNQALKYAKKRRRSVSGRNKVIRDLHRQRETARSWLMCSDTTFQKVAATLDIDAEVIRNALRATKHWAGRYA